MTQIATRRNAPFDAVIGFHLLANASELDIARELLEQQTGISEGHVFSVAAKGGAVRVQGLAFGAADTANLLSAWNAPDGDMAIRCFMPNHGIATWSQGRIDWMAAICFQCCNARQTGVSATSTETRLLDAGTSLQSRLLAILPEREFRVWEA